MAKQIHIDAKNAIVGRLGSHVAKQALLGHTIKIFNCEKAVMTGPKKTIQERYFNLRVNIGQPMKGPYIRRQPDRFVRRIIRGMLPREKARGRDAYKKIMCYIGVPEKFAKEKLETIKYADAAKLTTTRVQTMTELCKSLGWKGDKQ